jgi:hypothetical protein
MRFRRWLSGLVVGRASYGGVGQATGPVVTGGAAILLRVKRDAGLLRSGD